MCHPFQFGIPVLDQKNKKQQSEAMDPINALQNLTNQGARNPMPNPQMMGNNPNANVLQNLIHVNMIIYLMLWHRKKSSILYILATRWPATNARNAKYARFTW